MDDMYQAFAEVYDLFMEDVPYDRWAKEIIGLLKEEGIDDGLVCELGCGTGQMTRRLAAAGYDMTGIDASFDMLMKAREYEAEGILYLEQDMREFELYGTMAAIVSVCDSMNYLTDDGDMEKVFSLVKNYLDPGGIFIFDVNTVYKYENILGEQIITDNREEGSFIWENYYDRQKRINEYELTLFIRDRQLSGENGEDLYKKYEETHFQRAYGIDEITEKVNESGLILKKVLDTDTMQTPSNTSERVCFVIQKGV
ncbi:MAG: class I SAM-dependent methyltransferase [Lachnospiraceae bacterium]|nr:class I SAM-dependent methyltransferase [Lachnospiraceae bacterium]